MTIELGKITQVRVGYGGYQDAMFGVWMNLGGKAWGVSDGRGTWATYADGAKYSREEWRAGYCDAMVWLRDICAKAKVTDANALVGKPIEATFDGMKLESWRILEEVL